MNRKITKRQLYNYLHSAFSPYSAGHLDVKVRDFMNANKSKGRAAVLHGWMAANLKDSDIPKLRLARMALKDSTLDQYYDESPLPPEEGKSIIKYLIATSYFWSIIYQHIGFDETNRALVEKVHLAEDGQFSFGDSPDRAIGILNAFFANVLTTGNRLVESTERNLKQFFNEDSETFVLWKTMTKSIYDTDLAYVLCKKLRNIYEHDNVLINVTEPDLETGRAYAVINLEHELRGKDIPFTHIPVAVFLREREQSGVPPRRNIGFILRNFFSDVTGLSVFALTELMEAATDAYEAVEPLFQTFETDDLCVVAHEIRRKGFPDLGVFPINTLKSIQDNYVEYVQYYKNHFDLIMDLISKPTEDM